MNDLPPPPPAHIFHVDRLHPQAADANPGTREKPMRTISRAAAVAQPGDTVLVHAGVYRERVAPARSGEPDRPIRYEAASGESVFVRGSEVFNPRWEPSGLGPEIRSALLDPALFGDFNPFKTPALRLPEGHTLGQVFVEGAHLLEVSSEADLAAIPGSWKTDGERLLVHFPVSRMRIEDRTVEITVRERIFSPIERGLGYIEVRGFIFEHCANQFPEGFWKRDGSPQAGAVGFGAGHHWTFEHNMIRWAKSIGLDCGAEGALSLQKEITTGWHVIRYNQISDSGACGIAGAGQRGTRIQHNIVERSNHLGWTAYETAGIKVHFFHDGLIEGNLLLDNDASGIWLDNVWYGSRVTRNVVLNSTGSGIFVEMGNGPLLVDNNVVAFTRTGDGIYLHDASGVTLAHNFLYANAHFGVYARIVTERIATSADGTRELVESSRLRILNNIIADNYRGHVCLPLAGERVAGNVSDFNLLLNGAQWQWEGHGFNQFAISTNNNRISMESIAEALRLAFETNNVPENERPNLERWSQQPALTLDWWRMLTGNDTHSIAPEVHTGEVENGAVEKGSLHLAPHGEYLAIGNGAMLGLLQCPPVEGVDRDFQGKAMPEGTVSPGPFQQFQPGKNRFILRPAEIETGK